MRLFVSYRRNDEAITVAEVVARLRARFGVDQVFFDMESLEVGEEFWPRIATWIAECDVVLVMVGRFWQPGRLKRADDYVRREIERSFQLGKTVVPVSIDSGRLPRLEQLPTLALRRLHAVNHGQRLRIPPDFDNDVASLITQLHQLDRTGPSAAATTWRTPRRPARCVGRDSEVATLVSCMIDPAKRAAVVLGPPGIGKSTVLAAAAHDDRVVESFGDRRAIVACQSMTSGDDVLSELSRVIGIEPGDRLEQRTLHELAARATLVVLDNFESVSDADPEGSDQLLAILSQVESLSLAVGYQGNAVPISISWSEILRIRPLPVGDARQLFVDIAPNCVNDPLLATVVDGLDGHALSVVVFAHLAQAEPSLHGLVDEWDTSGTSVLRSDDGRHDVTHTLAVATSRLSPVAIDALGLLAHLPDGIPIDGLSPLLTRDHNAGVRELRRRGLLHDDLGIGRSRLLEPTRNFVLHRHPTSPHPLHERAVAVLIAPRAAIDGDPHEYSQTWAEFGNIVSVLAANPATPLAAWLALVRFQYVTGIGGDAHLTTAAEYLSGSDRALLQLAHGGLAVRRSNNERARQLLTTAHDEFDRIGDDVHTAQTLRELGELAFLESDDHTAADYWQHALELFETIGDRNGQADCANHLGRYAIRTQDYERARRQFDRAIELYRSIGQFIGQANSLTNLARLELTQSNLTEARRLLALAEPLYRRGDDRIGEAYLLRSFGEAAYRDGELADAASLLYRAEAAYRSLGDRHGQANCYGMLSWIALDLDDTEAAGQLRRTSLAHYESIHHLRGIADSLAFLGRLTKREQPDQADELFERAAELYDKLDLPDLAATCRNATPMAIGHGVGGTGDIDAETFTPGRPIAR
jgi:hypothetical protein